MIGSDTFIIVALRCTEKRTSSARARAICAVRNSRRGPTCITVASTTSPASTGIDSFSTVVVPSEATCSTRREPGDSITTDCSLERKSSAVMCDTLVFESGDHAPIECGCFSRVLLHGQRGPAVGVALAQHRVHGRALHPVVPPADAALLVGLGVVGVVRHSEAQALQLGDRRLQLRDRRRDVRQLDDVRLGMHGELAQLAQRVTDPLVLPQVLRELGEHAPGEGDVARLHRHPGHTGVRLDDRQEGVGRQQRRLVGEGVDDRGFGVRHSANLPTQAAAAPGRLRSPPWRSEPGSKTSPSSSP